MNPWSVSQQSLSATQQFPSIYAAVFTGARYLVPVPSYIQLVHNTPHLFNNIPCLHLRYPSDLFPSGITYQNFVCISHPYHTCYMTIHNHRPWADNPNAISRGICKLWTSLLRNFVRLLSSSVSSQPLVVNQRCFFVSVAAAPTSVRRSLTHQLRHL